MRKKRRAGVRIKALARHLSPRPLAADSHNWLWSRSADAASLRHVTFDEFVAATYEPAPPPEAGAAAIAAAAARQRSLRELIGHEPSSA